MVELSVRLLAMLLANFQKVNIPTADFCLLLSYHQLGPKLIYKFYGKLYFKLRLCYLTQDNTSINSISNCISYIAYSINKKLKCSTLT